MDVQCPNCQAKFDAADEDKGKNAKCPKCNQLFVLAALDVCVRCGEVIGKTEKTYVIDGGPVCAVCDQKLAGDTSVPELVATGHVEGDEAKGSQSRPDSKTEVLAIMSLVLGILTYFTCYITAIPAVICGIIALIRIGKSAGQLKGNGLAAAGIIIPTFQPIVAILLSIVMIHTMLNKSPIFESLTPGKSPGTLESIQRGEEMYWIKCRNPECENEWQMDKKDYFLYLRESQDPMSMMAPAIVCSSCGKGSGYRAEKCEKCKLVFERGSVPNDFADRCPECSFSKTEERRKEAREKNK
jgi:predicted Zn finger-like uncharacterized protein